MVFHARQSLLFLSILLLLSSCGAIHEARLRDKSRKNNTNESHSSADSRVLPKYEKIVGSGISKKSVPLYSFIDHWIGVPYCYGGMSHKCTDCSGFVCNLYKDVYHIELPHTSEKQHDMAHIVKKRKLKEGQLVFFDTDKGKSISHVGVYLGNNKFVHASSSHGVRIDDLEETYYKKTFKGGGKVE
jgi:cell wall-associated NlpC family hydrolase